MFNLLLFRDPSDMPKGFLLPDEESIKVTFHVILPLHFWEWDNTSKIGILFGHPGLGGWNYCHVIENYKQRYAHTYWYCTDVK